MPEGQFTGVRATYEYTADSGTVYLITLDTTLGGLSETGLVPATSATLGVEKPQSLNLRGVYWQGVLDGRVVRKRLVCNTSGSIYADTSQSLTIDGVAGFTTGRVGEKFTFRRLPAA